MRSILLVDAAAVDPPVAANGADGVAVSGEPEEVGRFMRVLPAEPPFVRLAGLRLPAAREPPPDLGPLVAAGREGIVVSGFSGPADLVRLSAMLAACEAMAGLDDGTLGIIAVLDNPAAFLDCRGFREAPARLSGISWNAASLAEALGVAGARQAHRMPVSPLSTARSLCLMAAAAAGVPAYDTAFSSNDINILRADTEAAREDGFAGKFARAEHVATINSLFDPNRLQHP